MRFYLIKRGHFNDHISYNDITGIDDVMNWDYMGSSEFEWGAPRQSLVRIMNLYYNHNFVDTTISMNGKKFIVMFPYGWTIEKELSEIIDLFTTYLNNPYGGKYHLKEMLNFDEYFQGEEKIIVPGKGKIPAKVEYNFSYADFWWDIDNDFFIFPDENNNRKIMNYVFKALEKKEFGKGK